MSLGIYVINLNQLIITMLSYPASFWSFGKVPNQ